MKSSRSRQASRGFTLIELLVVIAIIAILAAILFPVFAQAREKARQATCLSNQKQIMLGVITYMQDYDQNWPVSQSSTTNWDGNVNTDDQTTLGFENIVDPYIKAGSPWGMERDGTVWHCPSDVVPRNDCDGGIGIGTGFAISYVFTSYNPSYPTTEYGVVSVGRINPAAGLSSTTIPNFALNDAKVQDPSGTVVMYELWSGENYSRFRMDFRSDNSQMLRIAGAPYYQTYPYGYRYGNYCGDGTPFGFFLGGHMGRMQVAFADGHVKSVAPQAIMTLNSAGAWNGAKPNLFNIDPTYH